MERSESIKELATALSKFQSEVSGAVKSADNPFFKSKYADLAEIWKTIRPHLAANGLAVSQGGLPCEHGSVSIETMLMHNSGEYISGITTLRLTKDDAQGAGSAITYARRYGLAAILGIHQEDDDANSQVYVDPAADKAAKEQAKADKKVNDLHAKIKQAIGCLADKKIDGFDAPSRVENSCKKHLAVVSYDQCRNIALMETYVETLRTKFREATVGNATAPAPTAGQFAHDKSELLIAIVRCNLTGEEKEDLQRLVNSAKTAEDLEAVRKSLAGAK